MNRYTPSPQASAYAAGQLIYDEGSKLDADLFARVDYGSTPSRRRANLERDIELGWLRRVPVNRIALTDWALAFYENDAAAPAPAFVGQVAAPRQVDLLHRPPISKRFLPNPRGMRSDIPDWSVRHATTIHKA